MQFPAAFKYSGKTILQRRRRDREGVDCATIHRWRFRGQLDFPALTWHDPHFGGLRCYALPGHRPYSHETISSTSRTSIMGVTLMAAQGRPMAALMLMLVHTPA
jgi:hypothetical protein